ncbi:MAG: ParB/RepB/Spo0J family partition protein [Candidatus Bathyarchaeia archaeon]
MTDLEIEQLTPPPWLLRPINEDLISELARSIENSGLLQPIVVRKTGAHEKYEVVCGNHRLMACKRLGLTRISAVVTELNDEEAFLARVSENLLKNVYVDPIQEANGYKVLLTKGWTINAIAKRVGKSDSYICQRLSIIDHLAKSLSRKLSASNGSLTPSHAELLAKIRDVKRQIEVAEFVERKHLSVRGLEALLNGGPPPRRIELEPESNKARVIRIPMEFLEAIGAHLERSVHIYVDGKKLIIENIYRSRRRLHV